MTPYFFGYGSLVNRATHSYPDTQPAALDGWSRIWVRTAGRDTVFLSVIPRQDSQIDGLIAAVPNADWTALDQREHGYHRIGSGRAIQHASPIASDISHYAVPEENRITGGQHVILQSYLDVVVQGFLQIFGEAGVTRFFDTTLGWDVPILNDRNDPRYPRHCVLSPEETALCDAEVERVTRGL